MKRALSTFGNRFGLCLYDKDQQGVARGKCGRGKRHHLSLYLASGWILKNPVGTALEVLRASQLFYSTARKMLEGLREPTAIKHLWQHSEDALKAIRTTVSRPPSHVRPTPGPGGSRPATNGAVPSITVSCTIEVMNGSGGGQSYRSASGG